MTKPKGTTAADYALQAVCVWRQRDRENLAAKAQLDPKLKWRAGNRLHHDTNKLREAADAYMGTSDPPP